jgi:hypothetical protein
MCNVFSTNDSFSCITFNKLISIGKIIQNEGFHNIYHKHKDGIYIFVFCSWGGHSGMFKVHYSLHNRYYLQTKEPTYTIKVNTLIKSFTSA